MEELEGRTKSRKVKFPRQAFLGTFNRELLLHGG
jgi:hypothetical protein